MTHDELLAEIIGDDGEALKIETLRAWQSALRAVVELHYQDFGTPGENVVCDYCKVTYPCQTIQAIEKELE